MRRGFSMSNQVHCRRPVRNLTLTGCFAAVLGGLILFLCLVCVSVTVTLNFRPLYYLDMKLLHISDSSGYSNDVIRKNFDVLIRYNNIWHTGILNFPDFPMSESGRIHFEEVKKVFSVFEYGALILIPLSAVEIIAAKKKRFGSLFAAAGIISGYLIHIRIQLLRFCQMNFLCTVQHLLCFLCW